MFFDIVLNMKSTCILFLSPTKNAIAAPISKINWFDPSKDESP